MAWVMSCRFVCVWVMSRLLKLNMNCFIYGLNESILLEPKRTYSNPKPLTSCVLCRANESCREWHPTKRLHNYGISFTCSKLTFPSLSLSLFTLTRFSVCLSICFLLSCFLLPAVPWLGCWKDICLSMSCLYRWKLHIQGLFCVDFTLQEFIVSWSFVIFWLGIFSDLLQHLLTQIPYFSITGEKKKEKIKSIDENLSLILCP